MNELVEENKRLRKTIESTKNSAFKATTKLDKVKTDLMKEETTIDF
jgi:phage shock protein A